MTRLDDATLTRVPDLYLERYRLGELPDDERDRIERLLELDLTLRHRLSALEDSEGEIARELPAPLMDGRIRARARAGGTARRVTTPAWRGWLSPALAAAAVVLAVGAGVLWSPGGGGDGIRLKGASPGLVVFRKTGDGSERLEPGATVHPGDLIRLGYRAAGRSYGAIVSTDGNGAVTMHLPASGGKAATLKAGGTVLLDFSYELDAAPRWERFYLVTGDQPFDVEPVRRAALEVAEAGSVTAPPALSLDAGLEQSVFSLTKESVP
jgi:hypothetical protein